MNRGFKRVCGKSGALATWRSGSRRALATGLLGLAFFGATRLSVFSGDNLGNNEYQFNLNPYHPLVDNLDMFGNLGYDQNSNSQIYRFGWPGFIFHTEPWLQLWGGLDSYYTDNYTKADKLELRPFAGTKVFVPNQAKLLIYNFTRYEYRDFENEDTHDWNGYSLIRSRFGVEVPLTSRDDAWEPKTFYLITDVEPFYRFDPDEWEELRLRGGIGYIFSDRIRAELIYTAQFVNSSSGDSLEYSENIIRFNIKIALEEGIFHRLLNPGD